MWSDKRVFFFFKSAGYLVSFIDMRIKYNLSVERNTITHRQDENSAKSILASYFLLVQKPAL